MKDQKLDETKTMLTLIATVAMHALLSREENVPDSELAFRSIEIAQEIVDGIDEQT
tara:strand:+ start:17 stop:184 length:168 start_codon:yes stop_codon:yes gene_type:complete